MAIAEIIQDWSAVRFGDFGDPQFLDCKPGETKRLVGRVWFFEGANIDVELKRLAASKWQRDGI